MTIDILTSIDHKFLVELQPEGWPDILPHFHFYHENDNCFPIKVIINNKIVGIGAAIIHSEIAWLGHIIVHNEYRNQGIVKRITQSLVDLVHKKGCETIYLIATDLGAPVYEKVGFESEGEYSFYKNLNIKLKPSGNVIEFKEEFSHIVYNLDFNVTGENRTYLLEKHLKGAYVYRKEGEIQGFYLPALGEGLLIANNDLAGTELMKMRLSVSNNALIPSENLNAIEFLKENGAIEFKRAKRMRLGEKKVWFPNQIYNRIGGNIG